VARELDEQLLEAAGVRRRRLLDALAWGAGRRQLATPDNLTRFLVSVVVAALICAGCVGFSFAKDALQKARANQGGFSSSASATPTPQQSPR